MARRTTFVIASKDERVFEQQASPAAGANACVELRWADRVVPGVVRVPDVLKTCRAARAHAGVQHDGAVHLHPQVRRAHGRVGRRRVARPAGRCCRRARVGCLRRTAAAAPVRARDRVILSSFAISTLG